MDDASVMGEIALVRSLGHEPSPSILRRRHGLLLDSFSDQQISGALSLLERTNEEPWEYHDGDDAETSFRRAEFAVLRSSASEDQLQTDNLPPGRYADDFANTISGVTLVQRLRETRALTGFARVYPDNDQAFEQRKNMLRLHQAEGPNRWLPAYAVFGEGIFIELDESRVRAWEERPEVVNRAWPLNQHFEMVRQRRRLPERLVRPRLVLLHTLAHLLINQLTFDCGYSTAALRERLYASSNSEAPMAALLIYTAAGDSEGTMGGLVRMGRPGDLERVFRRAIQNARWCSADPVCMELGATGGQGPDSCNLAACHNCALVPETSCEQFNRFLDRWMLVGTPEEPDAGFFAHIP